MYTYNCKQFTEVSKHSYLSEVLRIIRIAFILMYIGKTLESIIKLNNFSYRSSIGRASVKSIWSLGSGLWYSTQLSTIFQLYRSSQFYWWRKLEKTFRKSLTNFITLCCTEYTSSWTGFELTTLVMIGTDCTGSCKSNFHTITFDIQCNFFLSNISIYLITFATQCLYILHGYTFILHV